MTQAPCPCGCSAIHPAHAIARALAHGDLGAALDEGLLEAVPCPGCRAGCAGALRRARDARLAAFAARERHRARQARLALRQRERDARRATRAPDSGETASQAKPKLGLPPAAAAALARARARAAGRDP